MVKKLSLSSRFSQLFLGFLVFGLTSCDLFKKQDIEYKSITVDFSINRLDSALFGAKGKSQIADLIAGNRRAFNLYLDVNRLPDDSILVNMLHKRINDPYVDSFYRQCDSVFGDFSAQQSELRKLYQHVKYYYPDFQAPDVHTFFTGFLSPKDILITPQDIVIGLEYFIGRDAKYVSNDPQYILDRYSNESLVPMFIGLGISNFFNETNHEDHSLMAEMVYYGKAHYFLSKMVYRIEDEMNLGYTPDDIKFFEENEKIIWAYLVDNKLLFETNRIETAKYVSERPKTLEISPECPGRVGRWIGFQIVKKYMDRNSEVSLQELMAEKDAQKIFRGSSYNPSR
jgi:hypothetical protein